MTELEGHCWQFSNSFDGNRGGGLNGGPLVGGSSVLTLYFLFSAYSPLITLPTLCAFWTSDLTAQLPVTLGVSASPPGRHNAHP